MEEFGTSPERCLILAVIAKAVDDLEGIISTASYNKNLLKDQAGTWFLSKDCMILCNIAGISHEALIKRLKKSGYLE